MTYKEYKQMKQEGFAALPIFWAFSNEQFDDAMKERGLKPGEDNSKIVALPYPGGFAQKKDVPTIKAYVNRKDNLKELMKDKAFAEEAFYYEMSNHEYHLNTYQGDWDVCSCFGSCDWDSSKDWKDYLSEMGYGEDVVQYYQSARDKFFKACDENDWW